MKFISNSTLHEIMEKFGYDAQIIVSVEELAELQKAICKVQRRENPETVASLIEEIADVELMIEQLKYIFNIKEEDLTRWKEVKMEKVMERLGKAL